jgi:hypothetical protein
MNEFRWGGRLYREANLDEGGDSGDAGEGDDKSDEGPWPTDWRQQIAGDDEKALNQLGRYATPADVWTKARALEQRVTSGELKDSTPFPEKGSDEEKAEWRVNHGVPESHDKYEIARELEKEDRESLNGFLEYAHNKNMGAGEVNTMIDYFYQRLEEDETRVSEGDKVAQKQAEDELRVEWGGEYRAHMNRIEALIDMVPGEAKESFLDARLPDGTKIRSNPDVMKFLLNSAIAFNPATTIVPADGDVMSGIQDEIDQIKEVMKTNRKKYNSDEKMQAQYRKLLEAQEKAKPGSIQR